jgi:hypothetical protein
MRVSAALFPLSYRNPYTNEFEEVTTDGSNMPYLTNNLKG